MNYILNFNIEFYELYVEHILYIFLVIAHIELCFNYMFEFEYTLQLHTYKKTHSISIINELHIYEFYMKT